MDILALGHRDHLVFTIGKSFVFDVFSLIIVHKLKDCTVASEEFPDHLKLNKRLLNHLSHWLVEHFFFFQNFPWQRELLAITSFPSWIQEFFDVFHLTVVSC